jgi:hypothetical protein
MDDTTRCHICGNRLRNLKLKDKLYHPIGKISTFIERSCHKGKNHYLQLVTDIVSGKVDYLKFSLDPKYSKLIEIKYFNDKCNITFVKNNMPQTIEISKILEPDFPDLVKLKQQINLYAVFS